MSVLQNFCREGKGGDGSPPSKHPPRPTRPPVNGPLFDARFRRHVDHLFRLGPRPVGECLSQLVGTNDDARTALIVLLERYGELDAGVVQALGADVFPPAPLHEVQG